jgi:pimeloyl-ACP methyl ester carboxylesterase
MSPILRVLTTVSMAAVCLVASALTAPADPRGVGVGSSSFSVRCSLWRTANVDVDWYAPVDTPKALVFLQHGWLGSKRQMRDAALAFASDGYLVAAPSVASLSVTCGLNNGELVRNIGSALGDGTVAQSGRAALGELWPGEPDRVVVAGHSIGAAIASLVASSPGLRDRVRLVIHLDGVESITGYLHDALQVDRATPILQLTVPPSSLNAQNSGPRVVATFRPGGSFEPSTDGALLTSATHCDPLGDYPFNVCGSTPENQRAFFDLAVAGANQALGAAGETFDVALARLGPLAVRTPHLS